MFIDEFLKRGTAQVEIRFEQFAIGCNLGPRLCVRDFVRQRLAFVRCAVRDSSQRGNRFNQAPPDEAAK